MKIIAGTQSTLSFPKMGTASHIDIHIRIDGSNTVTEGHNIAHRTKDELFRKFPQLMDVHIHIEPNESE